jgi:hypothetical protein
MNSRGHESFDVSVKTNFDLTKETGEHDIDLIGTECGRIRVRESLKARTSRSNLLPISHARRQPCI